MTDKKEDPIIITITGPDGDERDYVQDTVIPFAGKEFAVLVSIPEKEDSEEEPDIILARIDRDENGEAVYLPPTDEEYDAVADIYDAMYEIRQRELRLTLPQFFCAYICDRIGGKRS